MSLYSCPSILQIEKWVADYNTFDPHSALGMKTPAEFFKLKLVA